MSTTTPWRVRLTASPSELHGPRRLRHGTPRFPRPYSRTVVGGPLRAHGPSFVGRPFRRSKAVTPSTTLHGPTLARVRASAHSRGREKVKRQCSDGGFCRQNLVSEKRRLHVISSDLQPTKRLMEIVSCSMRRCCLGFSRSPLGSPPSAEHAIGRATTARFHRPLFVSFDTRRRFSSVRTIDKTMSDGHERGLQPKTRPSTAPQRPHGNWTKVAATQNRSWRHIGNDAGTSPLMTSGESSASHRSTNSTERICRPRRPTRKRIWAM